MMSGLKIYFDDTQEEIRVTYKLKMLLRRAIIETLGYEGVDSDCEVSLTFTDNEGIRDINNRYRGIDKATDVLSFPQIDYENEEDVDTYAEEPLMLGDIVISLERAVEQANEFGHSFERECAFLCVHSVLHLLGYDHELSEEDDEDMRRRQRDVMEIMGLSIK